MFDLEGLLYSCVECADLLSGIFFGRAKKLWHGHGY
jgi:hypothetical protein